MPISYGPDCIEKWSNFVGKYGKYFEQKNQSTKKNTEIDKAPVPAGGGK